MAASSTLQFGVPEPGLVYADRPAAFGVVERAGAVALVKVETPQGTWRDLPGGAIEAGEDEAAALMREFGEETGLVVRPQGLVTRADQYFRKTDGTPVNNRAAIYRAALEGEDAALKIEDDHTLEWWDPALALKALRHDSHAWALAAWMRSS
jgi:8-oxo-dGTP diphosphatase